MDAQTIRCPQCGAATSSGAPRCPYCRARLATVSCPSCLSLMFAESRYCGRCGAERARVEAPSSARCPACKGGMQSVTAGAAPLLECISCDGLWVGADAFERICAEARSCS